MNIDFAQGQYGFECNYEVVFVITTEKYADNFSKEVLISTDMILLE